MALAAARRFLPHNFTRVPRCCMLFAGSVALLAGSAHATVQYTITPLGPIVATDDAATDINASGVAAYTSSPSAYLWQGGVSTPLPGVGGALSINTQSNLSYNIGQQAWVRRSGVATNLGSLGNEGGITRATDLNDSNTVVGYSYRNSQLRYRAYSWQNGTMTELPGLGPGGSTPSGIGTDAAAINASGAIAGNYDNASGSGFAVVWNGATVTPLTTLSGNAMGSALDINASGQVAGFCGSVTTHQAVIWNGTTPTSLGALPTYTYSTANGINDSSVVVGTTVKSSNDPRGVAFLWSNGLMVDLNSALPANSGWQLLSANAINNNGDIVGIGTFNGHAESFVMTIPAPASCTLVGLAGAVCGRHNRIRTKKQNA